VRDWQTYTTSAAPGEIIMHPQDSSELLDAAGQCEFRTGVGMLLYFVKHSRPDLSNPVRELSKVMNGATSGHLKSLYRVIKFVLDSQHISLTMQPSSSCEQQKWELTAFSDSDYGRDRDTRRSISGYVIFLARAPISCRSKAQHSATLLSTEAEYVALSEVATEILFAKQVLEFLGVPTALPIEVHVENVGAMFLANNATTGQRTRHIDVRYHYVREYIDDGIMVICFVWSEKNKADP